MESHRQRLGLQQMKRSMWISIGAIVASMAVLVVLFSVQIFSFIDLAAGRSEAYRKIRLLVDLRGQVIDMETGVRGFHISKNTVFLEPFNTGLEQYPEFLRQLRISFGESEQRLGVLEEKIQRWVDHRRSFLNLGLTADREKFIGKEMEGKELVDEIRTLLDTMVAEIEDVRRERTQYLADSSRLALILGVLMGVALVAFLVWSVRLQIRRLFESYSEALASVEEGQSKLQEANDRLEERVEERTAALQVANSELESFCYSVSHDLRAPLRGIDGFSLALAEDCGEKIDEQGREYLGFIRQGVQRMGTLIDDLLQLSRISRADLRSEHIPARSLIDDVVASVKNNERAQVDFRVTVPDDLWIEGDIGLIRVLLENLLSNAVKYSSTTPHPIVEIGYESEGDRFYVKDNGVGFDMLYAEKLFQPFQRLHTDARFAGSGIGLATVKRVILRHGGDIWAHSSPGQGAAFYFVIPTGGGSDARKQSDSTGGGQQAGRAPDHPRP